MTVTLANAQAGDRLSIATPQTGITSTYDAVTGVLTLTGSATLAAYQNALGAVRFTTTSGSPDARTISVQATSITAPTASNIAVATIRPLDSDGDGITNALDIDDDNDGIVDMIEDAASPVPSLFDGSMEGAIDRAWTESTNPNNLNSTPAGTGWSNAAGSADTWKGPFSLDGSGYWAGAMSGVPGAAEGEVFLAIYGGFTNEAVRRTIPESAGVQPGDQLVVNFQQIFGGVNGITQEGMEANLVVTIDGVAFNMETLTYNGNNPKTWSTSEFVFTATSATPTIVISIRRPNGGEGAYFGIDDFKVYQQSALEAAQDPGHDGIVDRVDLDSDNDGIGDNIEAQATAAYLPPSGQSLAMVDGDRDGLDDRYDANVGDTTVAASVGLTPVDTDGDGTTDFIDLDSDDDGRADVLERGDGQPTAVTDETDTDRDGLLDIFEHGSVDDGFFVHDGTMTTADSGLATSLVAINLADSDADVSDNGTDAVPLSEDFDWRDAGNAPIIDLNSTASASDSARNQAATFAAAPLNIAGPAADVTDLGDDDLGTLTIAVGGVLDGNNETITMGGATFALATDSTQTVTVDGIDLLVSYTVATGFNVTASGGGTMPNTALDTLVRGMVYNNATPIPTSGTRTLTFVVTDTAGLASGPAVATVAIPPNLPPDAVDDVAAVIEDQPVAGNLLANDTDPEAEPLVVTDFTVAGDPTVHTPGETVEIPGIGRLTIEGDGAYRFVPVPNYFGPVPLVEYGIQDTAGQRDRATLTLGPVQSVPYPPVPQDPRVPGQEFDPDTGTYEATTQEDVPFSGQVVGTDGDGDVLTYTLGSGPTNGTVSLDAATGTYVYTPVGDFNGVDSFVVNIDDGNGNVVAATVNMNVTSVVDTADDMLTTPEETPLVIQPLANDSFENPGRVISALNDQPVAPGTVIPTLNGTVTFNADGTLLYTPNTNFNGEDSFSYTVTSGGVTERATVVIVVTPVNAPPVPGDPEVPGQQFDPNTGTYTAATLEDTPFNGSVVGADEEGDVPTYTLNAPPAHGTVTIDPMSGAYVYTPAPDFNGTDSFVVTMDDGNGGITLATVNMNVGAVPDAVDDAASTDSVTPVTIAVLGNDSFEDAGRTVTGVDGQPLAVGQTVAVANGTVTLGADGALVFTPDAAFIGQATFTYTVTAGGVTETATVAVDVLAPNTPPVPENPEVPGQDFDPGTNTYTAATPEDAPFSGQVRAGDPDGDVPSYTLGTPPAHGTVTLDAVTGAYVYTPTADFNGPDSFVVTVTDGRGAIVPMTVNMGVTPVVDIADDQAGTRVNTPVAIDFDANDSFESADHVLTAINGVPIAVGVPLNVANGTVTRNADGTLTFAPALDFSGSTSFDYTVTAGGVTETATVTVVVVANRPPVPGDSDVPGQDFDPNAGAYTATTVEDMAFAGRLAASDADGDPLTYTLTTPPANGTVTVDPATGAYTYVPRADFNGVDTFIVTVSDGMGGIVALPVNMLVTPVADAIDDSATTRANTPVVIAVGANDSFENPDHVLTAIDGAAVVAGTPVAVPNGTAVLGADGTLTFTPAPGFVGRTSFTYTVTSGGVTETATVTVDVNANRPPVPSDPGNVPGQGFDPDSGDYFITTPQDTPFGGRLAGADADGDTLAYTTETPPRNGTVVVNPDGSYAYVPNPGYVGEDSFVVRVDDGQGGEVTSTVYVNVTPVAQVQEVPPRQDFPFVARPPVPDDVGPPQPDIIRAPQPERNLDPDARPFADAQSLFAEPAVVIGVNGQGWLGGTPALASVGGAVLQATDGIASLGGLNTATGRGIVVSAVDDLSPLGSIDSRDAGRRGAWLRDGAGDPLAAEPGRIASLDLGSGVRLAMMQEGERVWLDVQGPVREVRASLANGGALPPWVHVDRRGFVAIDRPSNVDSLRLRLTVVPERGPARSQVIEIDFNSGEMREVGSRGASSRGGAGRVSQGQAPADVPDFGTQLARAASRAAADDAALLEALALV